MIVRKEGDPPARAMAHRAGFCAADRHMAPRARCGSLPSEHGTTRMRIIRARSHNRSAGGKNAASGAA